VEDKVIFPDSRSVLFLHYFFKKWASPLWRETSKEINSLKNQKHISSDKALKSIVVNRPLLWVEGHLKLREQSLYGKKLPMMIERWFLSFDEDGIIFSAGILVQGLFTWSEQSTRLLPDRIVDSWCIETRRLSLFSFLSCSEINVN